MERTADGSAERCLPGNEGRKPPETEGAEQVSEANETGKLLG